MMSCCTLVDSPPAPPSLTAIARDDKTIFRDGAVFVVDDSVVCGGTKARILPSILRSGRYAVADGFQYRSSTYGSAAHVLARTAPRLLPQPKRALIYEANRDHENAQLLACYNPTFVEDIPAPGYNAGEYPVLPPGFDSPRMVYEIGVLAASVCASVGVGMFDEVWCVSGTGTLVRGLQAARVTSSEGSQHPIGKQFYAVLVYPGSSPPIGNAIGIDHDQDISEKVAKEVKPPFSSNPWYDAKAWKYVLASHHANPGKTILFWNLAGYEHNE